MRFEEVPYAFKAKMFWNNVTFVGIFVVLKVWKSLEQSYSQEELEERRKEQVKGKSHQRTYSLGALSEASSLPVSALR